MTAEDLKHYEQIATGLRMVEDFGLADAVDELIAEVRRLSHCDGCGVWLEENYCVTCD